MRIVTGLLAFLAVAAAIPQDSFNFHARYGQPDVERFALRPDITMAVEYGSDGKACLLNIEPRQAEISAVNYDRPTMSKETATDLLKEVVPPETRGNSIPGGRLLQSGCAVTEFQTRTKPYLCHTVRHPQQTFRGFSAGKNPSCP